MTGSVSPRSWRCWAVVLAQGQPGRSPPVGGSSSSGTNGKSSGSRRRGRCSCSRCRPDGGGEDVSRSSNHSPTATARSATGMTIIQITRARPGPRQPEWPRRGTARTRPGPSPRRPADIGTTSSEDRRCAPRASRRRRHQPRSRGVSVVAVGVVAGTWAGLHFRSRPRAWAWHAPARGRL